MSRPILIKSKHLYSFAKRGIKHLATGRKKLIYKMDLGPINFSCKFCDRNFHTKTGFKFHIKTHSEESTSDSQEKSLKKSSKLESLENKELNEKSKFVSQENEEFKSKTKFETKKIEMSLKDNQKESFQIIKIETPMKDNQEESFETSLSGEEGLAQNNFFKQMIFPQEMKQLILSTKDKKKIWKNQEMFCYQMTTITKKNKMWPVQQMRLAFK